MQKRRVKGRSRAPVVAKQLEPSRTSRLMQGRPQWRDHGHGMPKLAQYISRSDGPNFSTTKLLDISQKTDAHLKSQLKLEFLAPHPSRSPMPGLEDRRTAPSFGSNPDVPPNLVERSSNR